MFVNCRGLQSEPNRVEDFFTQLRIIFECFGIKRGLVIWASYLQNVGKGFHC